MAHQLTIRANGTAEMAYAGETPWHGLGQKLPRNPSVEQMRKAAGMEFSVDRHPVQFTFNGKTQTFNDRVVLHRSDTGTPLSVVSSEYKVVQPGEVLEFFRDLCKNHGYELETAGTLYGGARYWALARCGESVAIAGKDLIAPYLLLATACDGSMATTAKPTAVRVVCNNTIQMAILDSQPAVKVRHSQKFDAQQVKIDLGLMESTWEDFTALAQGLAETACTPQQGARVMADAWGEVKEFDKVMQESGDVVAAIKAGLPNPAIALRIKELFTSPQLIGGDMESAKGTAWGFLNAATQYFDWEAKRTVDARLDNAWRGWGADRKVELAQALMHL